jgi:hypothetical protein
MSLLIPGSSVVEQEIVNLLAGGSNPSRGANRNRDLGVMPKSLFFFYASPGNHSRVISLSNPDIAVPVTIQMRVPSARIEVRAPCPASLL